MSKLTPVSKSRPCPVCGGDHKCSASESGLLLCGRRDGPQPGFRHLGPCRGGVWHKYREESGGAGERGSRGEKTRAAGPSSSVSPAPLLPSEAGSPADFTAYLTLDRAKELAKRLGLPVEVFGRLPGIGYHLNHGAWTFPEVNGVGAVVGHLLRFPDGSKKMVTGGHRGLTLPGGVLDGPDPLFLVEGPSDVLAMLSVELKAVGRPSNRGGTDDLCRLLADQPADRPLVVVGENDRKDDGLWPGRDGAFEVATKLAAGLNRQVLWTLPPDGYKDVRAWVLDRRAGAAETEDLPGYGRELSVALTRSANPVEPPGERPAQAPCKFPPLDDLADLGDDASPDVTWVWDGYFARDGVALLSALPKGGKTTLLSHLMAALVSGGSFCGRPLAAGRAVVISEEPKGIWKKRRRKLNLPSGVVRVYTREKTLRVKGSQADWAEFLAWLNEQLLADPADLIVFDTLSAMWPVRDENSASEVQAAVHPILQLATAGRSVLMVHHLRKSLGGEGTASRGSGALVGAAETILELRRVANDPNGCKRLLTGYGRYEETPAEWLMELVRGTDGAADAYVACKAQPGFDGAGDGYNTFAAAVLAVLPVGEANALTAKQVWERLPERVRMKTVRDTNRKLSDPDAPWHKTGGGRGVVGKFFRTADPTPPAGDAD